MSSADAAVSEAVTMEDLVHEEPPAQSNLKEILYGTDERVESPRGNIGMGRRCCQLCWGEAGCRSPSSVLPAEVGVG